MGEVVITDFFCSLDHLRAIPRSAAAQRVLNTSEGSPDSCRACLDDGWNAPRWVRSTVPRPVPQHQKHVVLAQSAAQQPQTYWVSGGGDKCRFQVKCNAPWQNKITSGRVTIGILITTHGGSKRFSWEPRSLGPLAGTATPTIRPMQKVILLALTISRRSWHIATHNSEMHLGKETWNRKGGLFMRARYFRIIKVSSITAYIPLNST